MKKLMAFLCATMLCACGLVLAACGGSSGSGSAASGSASASASAAANPAEKFYGEWKMAAAEIDGVMISGDLNAILGESNITLTVNEDGTAKMAAADQSADLAWEANGDAAITLMQAASGEGSGSAASASASASAASAGDDEMLEMFGGTENGTIDLSYADGALVASMEASGQSGTVYFTQDGTFAGLEDINIAAAEPITDEKALIGSWNISGLKMMGVNVRGDATALSAMAGLGDMSLVFEEGGKCSFAGDEAEYAIDASGTIVTSAGMEIPIVAIGDEVAIDMTELFGMEMVMLFSK